MYDYNISGYYFEGETRKRFDFDINAKDNIVAMEIALGRILLKAEEPVKLDVIHYEVL